METVYEKVYLDGNPCYYREIEFTDSWKNTREEQRRDWKREFGITHNYGLICPICNHEFKIGEIVYMVINNHKIFPNTVIHKSCTNENLLNTTKILKSKYEQYRKILEEFRAWI